jgi:transcriptional regulator with XRE-family HTH domain
LVVTTIKRQLKAQALTYRDVAKALGLSEPSVKRVLSRGTLTMDRLARIASLLGFTVAELVQEAAAAVPRLQRLTAEHEAELVADEALLLVAVCALNRWSLQEIVGEYRLTKAQCLKHLLRLDRMGIVELLPGDRIRPLVAPNFNWLPGGPIRAYFNRSALGDFLDSGFTGNEESLEFTHGMLTKPALAQLLLDMQRLRERLVALHKESAHAPLAERTGIGLLLAMRQWEPRGFRQLRRLTKP